MLSQIGTSTYARGFFRFVAPPTLDHFLDLRGLDPAKCHVFLKCGFGQLLFIEEEQYKLFNPVFNSVDVLADLHDLDFVMDIALCDRAALTSSFLLDVYEEAFPRLGAPDLDEMYSFVPALRLGGNRDADKVRKAKMEIEIPMLVQL
jgi:hypothetical protein